MTAVLIGLLGIIVGSVLQALTGWIGDSRAAKREHELWVRDKRADSFIALMSEIQIEMLNMLSNRNDFETVKSFGVALTAAQVYAPTQHILNLTGQIRDEVQKQRRIKDFRSRNAREIQRLMEQYEQAFRASLDIARSD